LYTAVFAAIGLYGEVAVAQLLTQMGQYFVMLHFETERLLHSVSICLSCDCYFPGHPACMALYSLIMLVCR